jgi:hypothetical protein
MKHPKAPCAEFPNGNEELHLGTTWDWTPLEEAGWGEATDDEAIAIDAPVAVAIAFDCSDVEGDGIAPTQYAAEAIEPPADTTEPIEIVDELAFDDVVDEGSIAPQPISATLEAAAVADTSEAVPPQDVAPGPAVTAISEAALPPEPLSASINIPDAEPEAPHTADPFSMLIQRLADSARVMGASEHDAALMQRLLHDGRLEEAAGGTRIADWVSAAVLEQSPNGFVLADKLKSQVAAWQSVLRGDSEDFAACGVATLDEWAASLVARFLGSATRAESVRRDLRRRGVAAFGLVEAA